ncbi:hypothetical protein GEMRC1_003375 [Eukaryota sp. GEM-RC1]
MHYNTFDELESQTSPNVASAQQFSALWRKNWNIQKKAIGMNLCTVLTPVGLLLLIVYLNYLVSTIDALNQTIPANLSPNTTYSVLLETAVLNNLTDDSGDVFHPIAVSASDDIDLGSLNHDECTGFLCRIAHLDMGNLTLPHFEVVDDIETHVFKTWDDGGFGISIHVSTLDTDDNLAFDSTVMYNHVLRPRSRRFVVESGRISAINDLHSAFFTFAANIPPFTGAIVTGLREFPPQGL